MSVAGPLPSVGTKSPMPPRITQPPARLYQKASVGVTRGLARQRLIAGGS